MLIWTLIIGFVAGLLASDKARLKEPSDFILPCGVGIVGAGLFYLAGTWVGWYRSGQPIGFVMSIVGAAMLLTAYNTVSRARSR